VFYVEGAARFSYGVTGNPDGSYVPEPGPGKSTNNVYDYNAYFGNVKAPGDPHALTADPMLVSPGTGKNGRASLDGYRTRPGSPLINSGKAIPGNGGNDKDFWGNPVPACGGTDRGAAEFAQCTELKQGKK
jgi:hypothetical protein